MTVLSSEEAPDPPIDLSDARRAGNADPYSDCVKVRPSEIGDLLKSENTSDKGGKDGIKIVQEAAAEKYGISAPNVSLILVGRMDTASDGKDKLERPGKYGKERQPKIIPSQLLKELKLRGEDAGNICQPWTPSNHSGTAEDATDTVPVRKTQPRYKRHYLPHSGLKEITSNAFEAFLSFVSRQTLYKLCALYMWWIFCISTANAQLSAHSYRTNCEAPTTVLEGEPAFVRCHFPDNPWQTKFDFHVVRYDLDGNFPIGDLILSCLWNRGKDEPSCNKKDDFIIHHSANDTSVLLNIASTKRQHAGYYFCGYATVSTDQQKKCFLVVKGGNISCVVSSPVVHVKHSTEVTCQYNSDLSRTREDFYIYRFNGNTDTPDKVLECTWDTDLGVTLPTCTVAAGYSFHRTDVSSTVTLQVNSAEQRHAGNYSCNVIPYSKKVHIAQCQLTVEEPGLRIGAAINNADKSTAPRAEQVPDTLVREGDSVFVTCSFPDILDSGAAVIGLKRVAKKGRSTDKTERIEQVLQCNHSSPCQQSDGYRLAKHHLEKFTVEVQRFSEQQEGVYICVCEASNIPHEYRVVYLHLYREESTEPSRISQAADNHSPFPLISVTTGCFLTRRMMFS